jgi:hypothetical protein
MFWGYKGTKTLVNLKSAVKEGGAGLLVSEKAFLVAKL